MAEPRSVRQDALADLASVRATSRWVITPEGVRLHVLDYGSDSQQSPLLVLPGISMPAIGMDFVCSALVDVARPMVVDLRGRGLSDSADSFTMADYVDDVAAVVEQLCPRPPAVLGHSLGARIAVAFGIAVPDRVRAVIAVDPPLSGPGRAPYPTTQQAFLSQLADAQRGTTAEEVARFWPRWTRRELELRSRWLSSCQEAALAQTHRGFETEDFFAGWGALQRPAVLVRGTGSPVVDDDGFAALRRANPRADYAEVAGAGHMVFWDEPEAAAAHLHEALAALGG